MSISDIQQAYENAIKGEVVGTINMMDAELFTHKHQDRTTAQVVYGYEIYRKSFPPEVSNEKIMEWASKVVDKLYKDFQHLCDLGYAQDNGDWIKIDKDVRTDAVPCDEGWEISRSAMGLKMNKEGILVSKKYKYKSAFKAILAFEQEFMDLESFLQETPRARDLLMGVRQN